jgi:tryptophan-rich hypothetical protein
MNYQTKNHIVSNEKLIGSKWTAVNAVFGWVHFHIITVQKINGQWCVEMSGSCDTTVRFWRKKEELKDKCVWIAGWLKKN